MRSIENHSKKPYNLHLNWGDVTYMYKSIFQLFHRRVEERWGDGRWGEVRWGDG